VAKVKVDYALVHAHAWDAGNESMRRAGRTEWNADDFDAAVAVMEKYYYFEEKEIDYADNV
jgi:hypothetical protein